MHLPRLTTQADNITGHLWRQFRRSRKTTDHIFRGCQTAEGKQEYSETLHQLLIDFKKTYDSVRGEILFNFLIEFGIPSKLVKLIKMRLNETYSKVRTGKNLSDAVPTQSGLKQGDALSPFLFNFTSEHAIRKVQANQEGLEKNVTHRLLICADEYKYNENTEKVC